MDQENSFNNQQIPAMSPGVDAIYGLSKGNNYKKRWVFLLCPILFLLLILGGVFYLYPKNYLDEELGVSFKIPIGWGNVNVKDSYSFTGLSKEITFSNRPEVKLVAASKNYLYPMWFESRGFLPPKEDPQLFCKRYQNFLGASPSRERNTNGEDIFRQNGSYNYGECDIYPPFVNVSSKVDSFDGSGTRGWIDINDSKVILSNINLSRSIFYKLDNGVYPSLTLLVDLPGIKSNGFCVWSTDLGREEGDYYLLKESSCVNFKEKDQIEKAFTEFETSKLATEVISFASKINIRQSNSNKVREIYENRFKDTKNFTSADIGVSFTYPKVLEGVVYDEKSRELNFQDNHEIYSFRMEVSSKEDMINAEKEREQNCTELCGFPPWIDSDGWQKESDFISSNLVGEINCPKYEDSIAGFYGDYCRIDNINGDKALVRYYKGHITEGVVRKEYVFYTPKGKRLDIFISPDSIFTDDLAKYRDLEKTDFTLKTAELIVNSIKLLK